jgi:transcriptional regulator with XRE-family HTH domain
MMDHFTERLKILRLERGLSQQELSTKLNIPRTTISSWELGRRSPDIKMLEILADFFKVSIDYLVGKTDTRNPVQVDKVLKSIHNIIKNDDELADYLQKLAASNEMQVLSKQIRNLSAKSIKKLTKIAKILEEDE